MISTEEIIRRLDEYDIVEFLEPGRMISDVMEEIDARYDVGLYGGLTEDEFADYIRNVYNVKCYERTILVIK